MERVLQQRARDLQVPVCFILGPPRSGTTLLYELLVRRFRFAYISNLAHRLYRTPLSATFLGRPLITAWRGDFESRYGHIGGWGAPSEGGWVWNRWVPESHNLTEEHAARLPVDVIRGTISGLSRAMHAPFLNKNVMHSVHMRLLDRLFPGCLFLHMHREPAANVRSILRARVQSGGPRTGDDPWWSVKPKEWSSFKDADLVTQASAQVYYVHHNIEDDTARLGEQRTLIMDYHGMCTDPRSTLERVSAFLGRAGVVLEIRDQVPARFPLSQGALFDSTTEKQIAASVERFWQARS
jgi:hypothetical protein